MEIATFRLLTASLQGMGSTRELPTGALFQSRNCGESVPCGDKWSKRTGRILAEYFLRIQYFHPLVLGNTPGLHLSTSLELHFHLFSHPIRAVARPKIDFSEETFHGKCLKENF